MGLLKRDAGGRRIALTARMLVGRAEGCGVRIESRGASAEHAVIFWTGSAWGVRDLGSKNGTFVAGRRLEPGVRAGLDAAAVLVFGEEAEGWSLEDAGPPTAYGCSAETGAIRAAKDGLLALPDASDPRVMLYQDSDGRWLIEADGELRPAADQDRIEAGTTWILSVPTTDGTGVVATTQEQRAGAKLVRTIGLKLEPSLDGENVELTLLHDGTATPLEARVHHDLLLALARARRDDGRASLPPREQGWVYVDQLQQELGIDLQHLNMLVLRARQHLGSAGVVDVGALFERRRVSRQIRLGVETIEIVET